MAKSMANASKAMQAMGAAADPQAMQQSMAAFSRENQKMDMASGAQPPPPQCRNTQLELAPTVMFHA